MPYDPSKGRMVPNTTAPARARSKTAGPNGSFPVGDPEHARLAEQMAPRSEHAGNITPRQEATIERKAKAELANTKPVIRPLRAKTQAKKANSNK